MNNELIVTKQEGKKQEGKQDTKKNFMNEIIDTLKTDLKRVEGLKNNLLEFNSTRKAKELNFIQEYLLRIKLSSEKIYFENTISVSFESDLLPLVSKADLLIGICISNNLFDIEPEEVDFKTLNAKINFSQDKLAELNNKRIYKDQEEFDLSLEIKKENRNQIKKAKAEKNKALKVKRNEYALELEKEFLSKFGRV